MPALIKALCHKAIEIDTTNTAEDARCILEEHIGIPRGSGWLALGGRPLHLCKRLDAQHVSEGHVLEYHLPLHGGKGGFGTLLRAGGKIAGKVSNKDSMRDLSGRRIREVEAETKVREWHTEHQKRLLEAQEEKARRKAEKEEKLQREIDAVRAEVAKARDQVVEGLEDRVAAGIKAAGQLAASTRAKRLRDLEAQLAAAKRMRLGLPDDMSDLDTSDSEESDSEQERQDGNDAGPSPKGVSSDHGADAPAEPPSASMPQANEDAAAARPDGEAGAGLSSRGKGCGAEGEAEAGGGSKEGDVAAEVDVEAFESVEDLEGLGMDVLKRELGRRGMKTGGTLRQRAERLFLLKGRTIADIEPKHLAAARRGKK